MKESKQLFEMFCLLRFVFREISLTSSWQMKPFCIRFLIKIFTFWIKNLKCKKRNQQKLQFQKQRLKNSGSIFVLSACYWASPSPFQEGWSAGVGSLWFSLVWPAVWSHSPISWQQTGNICWRIDEDLRKMGKKTNCRASEPQIGTKVLKRRH